MSLRELLPAWTQDLARSVLDATSPRRRRVASSRRHDSSSDATHMLSVSPRGEVLAGPFAGMRLPLEGSWGGMTARLVGSYEEELAAEIAAIVHDEPRTVLDVGCAEGYYAVGLARALPRSRIHAFDIEPQARRLCAETARLNGVRNVRVRGRADPSRLRRHAEAGCWIISDCEGYEAVLLDPERVPVLREVNMLVELHEFARPGVTDLMTQRFGGSHNLRLIDARPRTGADYPALRHLPTEDAQRAVEEGRPTLPHPMQWAVMRLKD